MAQPPEPGPLDSAPVQPPVQQQQQQQPNLDALVERKHPHDHLEGGDHHHQHHHQQQQQQHLELGHHHQRQTQHSQHDPSVVSAHSSGTPPTNDVAAIASGGTRPLDNRGGRSPGFGGDGKTSADAISTGYALSPNTHASAARPAEPAPAIIQDDDPAEPLHDTSFPAMSNTQPPPGAVRQPMTYASPAAYPPPGMPPVSQYTYPPQVMPPTDPYRPSPTTLPSMRTLDHRQPPQGQPQHGMTSAAHMGSPMAPSPTPSHMPYYIHPQSYMYDPMRFALAPGLAHDPRIALSGGRHKKEIKRRTKTGCLTCRKRRIKCDEAHPTCNNCKKSKRECLGYDPIFKQQQGPAAIQPAPSTQSAPPPAVVVPAPTVPSSGPLPYQAVYPPPLPPNPSSDPVPSSAPLSIKTEPTYDYSTAIDPALQGGDTLGVAGPRAPPRYQHNSIAVGAVTGSGDPNHLRAKKMKVDELVALGGAPPPPPASPPSPEMLDEITKLYYEVYVPGLSLFFETRWYDFTKNRATAASPSAMLHNNSALVSLFSSFIGTISQVKSTDPVDMVHSGHLETSVVWSLARLPLAVNLGQRQQYPDSGFAEDDPWEARGRLHVFETLITGETLQGNPLSPPPAGTDNNSNNNNNNVHPLRRNEFEFWNHLATYLLQAHASNSAADVATRERCLSVMRSLLDGRENRDVLYSVAVLREYTAHWDAGWNEQTAPSHLEESDPRCKLAVATRFIRDEATATGGTTNVVRRLAELAYRAFVRPGANVDKSRGGRG